MIEYIRKPFSLLAPFQHSRRSAEKRRRRVSTFTNMGLYFIVQEVAQQRPPHSILFTDHEQFVLLIKP